jgi:uncharacterized protein
MDTEGAAGVRTGLQDDLLFAFSEGRVAGVPSPVERVDTHLSHVFLSGDHAFKLKRAVRLPFVDFSTVDRRRAACQAELDINRRLRSPFYVEATAVTQDGGGRFRLGGDGDIVDWAVVMRRFDQSQQFDVMAREGVLSVDLVERAASRIVDIHAGAPATTLAGHAADYRQVIRTLRRTEQQAAEHLGLEPGAPAPYDPLDRELARVDALIESRRAQGKVRRVHGDLHLRNICLFEGEPTPFDALEFDERMATTDVLYDLAFLLMDLRRLDLPEHANAAMNRYWDATGEDEEALQLLPFFTSLRAAVRMVVAVEAGRLEEAQEYRDVAFRMLEQTSPTLVAIGGLSGVGKSAVARAVAPLLAGPAGARVLRSDILRKRSLGLKPLEMAGAEAYAPAQRASIYRELTVHAKSAMAAGASVVADATFRVSTTREAIACAGGPNSFAFWLDAPLQVRLARIGRRSGDASDADAAVAMKQEEPGDLGGGWRRLDARRTVGELAADITEEMRDAGNATREGGIASSDAGPSRS